MKKALCLVFALCFLLAIAVWSKNLADRNSILGSWETEIQVSAIGVSVPEDRENQTADMIYCFEFYEDGTGERSLLADEKYAGHIPDIKESFTYILDGDELALTQENGNIQIFSVSFSGKNLILDGRVHMELVRRK